MEESLVQPLSRIPRGRKATVVALAGGRGFQDHIVNMGLNVGCEIEVIHSSSGRGGPTLIAAGQTRLAIGHGMASKIMAAVDPE